MSRYLKPRDHGYLMEAAACIKAVSYTHLDVYKRQEQNTSMVAANEQNKFLLPAMVEGDFSRDEIAEDADGLQMMSFQRVKIPAGGALQFEVPTEDPDNPDYTRTLEGIILYNHSAYTCLLYTSRCV